MSGAAQNEKSNQVEAIDQAASLSLRILLCFGAGG
ncbi:hypothetical protein AWB80_02503 [Caballeronia pedi]|uniref:Uncharacterized protein n=1 Tax=Caballeronia pedi TaxID=1777141 RepID=A0A158APB8_9BURK|nr:hypothetical protein AWB80_02503 [Caballeronia pedi]